MAGEIFLVPLPIPLSLPQGFRLAPAVYVGGRHIGLLEWGESGEGGEAAARVVELGERVAVETPGQPPLPVDVFSCLVAGGACSRRAARTLKRFGCSVRVFTGSIMFVVCGSTRVTVTASGDGAALLAGLSPAAPPGTPPLVPGFTARLQGGGEALWRLVEEAPAMRPPAAGVQYAVSRLYLPPGWRAVFPAAHNPLAPLEAGWDTQQYRPVLAPVLPHQRVEVLEARVSRAGQAALVELRRLGAPGDIVPILPGATTVEGFMAALAGDRQPDSVVVTVPQRHGSVVYVENPVPDVQVLLPPGRKVTVLPFDRARLAEQSRLLLRLLSEA